MKEFDFDELDKAVSSLMGNVKKADDAPQASVAVDTKPAPAEPTIPAVADPLPQTEQTTPDDETSNEASPADDKPLPETDVAAVPVADAEELEPSAPVSAPSSIAARHNGRFMDVVHPSSDMKTAPVPASTGPREGITLQPTTDAAPLSPSAPVMDMIAPAQKRPTLEPTNPVTLPPAPEPEPPVEKTAPSNEPWSSPFLPDAQVEKRPLGGSSTSETGLSDAIAEELSKVLPAEEPAVDNSPETNKKPEEPAEPMADKEAAEPESDKPAKEHASPDDLQLAPEPADAPLPAELNSDLVAIESGQKSTATEETYTPAAPVESPAPTASLQASSALTTSSIPLQYNEQPSTGDSSHQPIYDNEAVHQPLAHPPKKKKGFLIIIMIVLVVLLGGGLGMLAYFLGLL
jgi:hypothetical protein